MHFFLLIVLFVIFLSLAWNLFSQLNHHALNNNQLMGVYLEII